jgi:hypothetical protein
MRHEAAALLPRSRKESHETQGDIAVDLCSACFSAGASLAQDTAVQAADAARLAAAQRTFASLDDNRDGAISRAEASEMMQLLVDFDRIDLDLDERLEAAEYVSFYSAGYRGSSGGAR